MQYSHTPETNEVRTKMESEQIYVAVVDGKVSHIYSNTPLRFHVVAWERDRPESIRISTHERPSTEKDKLIAELFHLAKDNPYDDDLLSRLDED